MVSVNQVGRKINFVRFGIGKRTASYQAYLRSKTSEFGKLKVYGLQVDIPPAWELILTTMYKTQFLGEPLTKEELELRELRKHNRQKGKKSIKKTKNDFSVDFILVRFNSHTGG